MKTSSNLDAAQVGKMFVTNVTFTWVNSGEQYDSETSKYIKVPGHWDITAKLSNTTDRYSNKEQTMSLQVEQGVGAKLAEVLLPVIVADASRKAQQLADDSKAMIEALGERALKCIAEGDNNNVPAK